MRGLELLDKSQLLFIEETGTGPAVVCIHGLGGGTHFFSAMAASLRDRNRTIAFDLPGAGCSPCTENATFSFETCADFVLELAARRASGPVVLLGHSLGTIVALKAAARAPERVRKIISVGGLPEPLDLVKLRLIERAAAIRSSGMCAIADSTLAVLISEKSRTEQPLLQIFLRRLLETADPNAYAAMAEALAAASAEKEVHALRAPFMAITGSDDRYAPPEQVELFLRRLQVPTQHHIIEGCGHLPFFEAPDEFNRTVAELLDA